MSTATLIPVPEPEYCGVCHRPKTRWLNEQHPVCECNGIQPYGPSKYPGEGGRLTASHPNNEDALWYKRADVDPILKRQEDLRQEQQNTIGRLWCMLADAGVCPQCGKEFSHDVTEPFAYCDCGTTEWTGKLPVIFDLRHQLLEAQRRVAALEQHITLTTGHQV